MIIITIIMCHLIGQMKDVSVFVGNTSDTSSFCAANSEKIFPDTTFLIIRCPALLYGRYIKICTGFNDTDEKNILSLAEVKIYVEGGKLLFQD